MVTGCGIGTTSGTGPASPVGIPGAAIKGQVYGGQQPITGASVYLYAAGSTGYGSAYPYPNGASSMLGSNVVTTDANGNFNITNDYMCPSATTEVYLEAVGGSPDTNPADNNPNIVQIVALGPCGGLANMSFITMNELTTVASAYALAPFMAGPSNIGTSAANNTGITNAFATVNKLVNIQYGQINVNTVPSGATIPTAKLNTLADILASCVNQPHGGHAGDGTNCGTLFTDTTPPGGTAPTDTLSAAMNLAKYPGQFVSSLAGLASRMSPFQTIETSTPTDWTLTITYTASINGPGAVAADQLGNIWVVNNAEGSLVELTTNGSPAGPWMIGSVSPGPLAIDLVGDAWVGSTTANSLFEIAPGGAFGSVTGSGLGTTTSAIAIDGSGNIWAAGSGARLSEFSGSTHAPLSAAGYSGGGLSAAKSIAITPH
jgi:hypothetical protein